MGVLAGTGLALALLLLTAPAWAVSTPYLDDNGLITARIRDGFWGPTLAIYHAFSWYRILDTVGLSFVYATDHLWVIRLLGVLAHVGVALLGLRLLGRLGVGRFGSCAFLVMFALFPYSLEATTWPAAFISYPLALLVVVCSAAILLHHAHSRLATAGASLLATAAILLNEQVLPVVGLVLLARVLTVRRSLLPVIMGVLPPMVAFVGTIWASLGTNPRFSGSNAASLANLLRNISFVREYSRLTPFGDLFWDPSGFRSLTAALGVLLGVVITGLALVLRASRRPSSDATRETAKPLQPEIRSWASQRRTVATSLLVGGMLGAAGTIAPLLTSGYPYLTARVLYLPVFCLGIAFCGLCEIAGCVLPRHAVAIALTPLLVLLGGWSGAALAAEASAYGAQLHENARILNSLMRAADPVGAVEHGQRVVVAGFPGTIVNRAQFGEHILNIAPANVSLAAARQGASQPTFDRSLDFRAGWEGVCLLQDQWVSLYQEYRDARPVIWQGVRSPTREAVFALWIDNAWRIQGAGRSTPYARQLKGVIPDCVHAETPPLPGPVS